MAQVLVPGVAQLSFSGTYNTQPWACVTHWQYPGQTGPWSQSLIQALADNFHTAYNTNCRLLMCNVVNTNTITAIDIGSSSTIEGTNTTGTTGGRTGSLPGDTSTCFVLSQRINSRYRGGHPRLYLPWGANGDINNGFSWQVGFVTAAIDAWVATVNAMVTNQPQLGGTSIAQVVPRYTYTYVDDATHHKYRKIRSGLLGVFVIQTYDGSATFGSQRRRLKT